MTARPSPSPDYLELERRVLDRLEVRYRGLGYRFYRGDGTASVLPDGLRGCQPDAVALGERGNEVIEILGSRRPGHQAKVRGLRERVRRETGWTLNVVYVDEIVDEPALDDPPRDAGTLATEARALVEEHPRAALLLYWSALEGLLRRLEPGLATRSMSPRHLVDVLDSYDYISSTESETLVRAASIRNAVAHGNAVDADEGVLATLADVVDRLTKAESSVV